MLASSSTWPRSSTRLRRVHEGASRRTRPCSRIQHDHALLLVVGSAMGRDFRHGCGCFCTRDGLHERAGHRGPGGKLTAIGQPERRQCDAQMALKKLRPRGPASLPILVVGCSRTRFSTNGIATSPQKAASAASLATAPAIPPEATRSWSRVRTSSGRCLGTAIARPPSATPMSPRVRPQRWSRPDGCGCVVARVGGDGREREGTRCRNRVGQPRIAGGCLGRLSQLCRKPRFPPLWCGQPDVAAS